MKIDAAGDRAFVVRFPGCPSRRLTQTLAGFARAAREVEGVLDAAPGHRTVIVEFDPARADAVRDVLASLDVQEHTAPGALHHVDVAYDGPDLGWVAERAGLSVADVVRAHGARSYDVRMIGSPGFVYLSAAPRVLRVPRRDDPRRAVPAGSVAVGGRQAGIYAREMPGGWRILGTAAALPDLAPGDRVRFVPA